MSDIVRKRLNLLDDYLGKLKGRYTIRLAILFGSFARGDWVEDSDTDLLIVGDEFEPNVGENYTLLKEYGVEPLGFRSETFLEEVERPNLLVLDALQYGKPLIAHSEYFENVMEVFKRTKDRFGLSWSGKTWIWKI